MSGGFLGKLWNISDTVPVSVFIVNSFFLLKPREIHAPPLTQMDKLRNPHFTSFSRWSPHQDRGPNLDGFLQTKPLWMGGGTLKRCSFQTSRHVHRRVCGKIRQKPLLFWNHVEENTIVCYSVRGFRASIYEIVSLRRAIPPLAGSTQTP